MKYQLSSKLNPAAKKLLLIDSSDKIVLVLVKVTPTADVVELEKELDKISGKVRSWMKETYLLSLEIPINCLEKLAELNSIVFVELQQPLRH